MCYQLEVSQDVWECRAMPEKLPRESDLGDLMANDAEAIVDPGNFRFMFSCSVF